MNITKKVKVEKLDETQGLVYAWASVIEENGEPVIDLQGDIIEESELEKAAFDFMQEYRDTGEMHAQMGVGTVVGSMVFTKELQKALGIDLKKVGWLVVMKVTDEEVKAKIAQGSYPMLSIGGEAEHGN
jgi:hypothetical protein